jgi:hypothetical protein
VGGCGSGPGPKHHVLTDGHGIPLALILRVPPVGGRAGRLRRSPTDYSPTAATTTTSTGAS